MKNVYLPETKNHGYLVRRGGIFGLKDSYAVMDDSGKNTIYTGKSTNIVLCDTNTTMGGKTVDTVSPDAVSSFKKYLPREQFVKMKKIYLNMDHEKCQSIFEQWASSTDEEK